MRSTSGLLYPSALTGSQQVAFTGTTFDWTVPTGVYVVTVDAYGAEGGGFGGFGGAGGKGGHTRAVINVTPGEVLRAAVGGKGVAFNGAGTGGVTLSNSGATGGGATDIRRTPYGVGDRLVVGGGGGGGGNSSGGPTSSGPGGFGGYSAGGNGTGYGGGFNPYGQGGGGGTQVGGGVGGLMYLVGTPQGGNGSVAQGGVGYGSGPGVPEVGGGGGGGGYYGGGGGGQAAGGGGGSSYAIPANLGVLFENGTQTGNGYMSITWAVPGARGDSLLDDPSGSGHALLEDAGYVLLDGHSLVPLGSALQQEDACYVLQENASAILVESTSFPNAQFFSYTGARATFTVPAGVTTLRVTLFGANGGIDRIDGGAFGTGGGAGHIIQALVNVIPGQTLYVRVGGTGGAGSYSGGSIGGVGGYNGGGAGGPQTTLGNAGGGGGGATDLRLVGDALSDRILVAGGGSGEESPNFGAGGNNAGYPSGSGPAPGTQTSGNALGTGASAPSVSSSANPGGGGGGGYWGGGVTLVSTQYVGSGGSSFLDGLNANPLTSSGTNSPGSPGSASIEW